ncbi:MAG: hypothetical protein DME09_21520 [Candidatus Rokuibacteriota bacterium]|nr:MAG: hypothetical protein DME09_21520 [Candidatus Rokubacteria bacterium]
MKRILATRPGWLAALALVVAGCATGPAGPPTQAEVGVYPAKGQSPDQQARDSQQCAAWAQQQTGYNPGQSAAAGAAIGAITGNAGTGAAVGAVAGGVGGGAIGGTHQYQTSRQGYDKAFAACMGGRGYSVSR